MRRRRLKKHPAELEVTAFINLIVVLVPFLLSTAVFSKLSVMELALPAATAPGLEQLKAEDLQLEIVLRADALEVGDRIGGLIQRIPAVDKAPDGKVLLALLQTIKQKFPEEVQASLLAESDTPYEHIVKVMDVSREAQFPEIAVGDAPVRKPK
ncbi:MAG: biopolymer transporter ExbD [Burkholderiaceae bacterium]|nr:biopolymer transporter ExbD [Burkholderiaceae bacterium]